MEVELLEVRQPPFSGQGDAENDLGEATDEVTEGRRGVALAATGAFSS